MVMKRLRRWIEGGLPDREPIEVVQQQLLLALVDCEDTRAERLRHDIVRTTKPRELWVMRSSIFFCVANRRSETEAARRINALLPLFEGWIDPLLLEPIDQLGRPRMFKNSSNK